MTTIDDVFVPTGLLSQKFPGYIPRDPQVKLARAVLSAFQKHEILMADAPTGTGKSVAYLVPAILDVQARGGKVVIVTSNIQLQEQLITEDLPMLASLLPKPFTFEIAKGFSNYACKDRMAEADMERMTGKRLQSSEEQRMLEEVLRFPWQKGDLSELPYELPSNVKRLTVIQSEDCLGKKCEFFEDCYPRSAKKRFGSSDVIVTNYHMYAIDMALHLAGSDRGVLPEHRLLVLDEAHNIAEICRSYFGDKLTPGGVVNICRELDASGRRAEKLNLPRKLNPDLLSQIKDEVESFFRELKNVKESKDYRARLNKPGMVDGKDLETLLRKANAEYVKAATDPGLESEARQFLHNRAAACLKRAELIQGARELAREGWIFYLDGDQRIELCGEPLDVADFMKKALWERDANPRGIVLCSATLAIGKGAEAFDFASKQLGLDGDLWVGGEVGGTAVNVNELIVDSPFDFTKSVMVVPKGIVEPDPKKAKEFSDAVAETVFNTATMAQGRTMALFTSYRNLEVTARRLQRSKFRVLKQGDAPRTELVKQFKAQPENTVLLGTDSFWEGVDCRGETLVALVIDKLPFDHFEDPVLDAIKENSDTEWGWFNDYYLPKAIIKFKQGFGRLIRSVADYGVCVVCDKRISSKGYGKKFKRSLPKGVLFSDRVADVEDYLVSLKNGEKLDLSAVA